MVVSLFSFRQTIKWPGGFRDLQPKEINGTRRELEEGRGRIENSEYFGEKYTSIYQLH